MTEIELQEPTIMEEPIDRETTERIIGIYVRDYGRLPTEDYEKSHRRKLEIPHQRDGSTIAMLLQELAAIVALRPKFLNGRLTLGQIEWLRKVMR